MNEHDATAGRSGGTKRAALVTGGSSGIGNAVAAMPTPMTEPLAHLDRDAMISPEDLGEAVRFLTRLGPSCSIPEILMMQAHDRLLSV